MFFRVSKLDGQTLVLEIQAGDSGTVTDLLEERGHGFALFGEDVQVPMAVVDGRVRGESWCTEAHLLAIEAHELGHILTASADEPTAERKGIELLLEGGFHDAARLLLDRGVISAGEFPAQQEKK